MNYLMEEEIKRCQDAAVSLIWHIEENPEKYDWISAVEKVIEACRLENRASMLMSYRHPYDSIWTDAIKAAEIAIKIYRSSTIPDAISEMESLGDDFINYVDSLKSGDILEVCY